ncbi:MAG: alpha/beta hydrolase [Anaerolineae bacterium]|nr:alpha/beta hydrolase [Anaerolineae bacterium]
MSTPKRRLPRTRQVVFGLLAILVLVMAGAKLYDSYTLSRLTIDFPPPGQFVAIESVAPGVPLKMHYLCQGHAEPTLVLEAGFGGGEIDWTPIMPTLAQHNRVCAFDRLGQDWSDAAPTPRTFSTAADELHSALTALGIQNPVVVGHSLGGAVVQIYAAKFPVRGVVLVEGLSRDVATPVVARLGSYRALEFLTNLGMLRPIGSFMAHPAYSSDLRTVMVALRSGSTALIRVSDEGAIAAQSLVAELSVAEPQITAPMLAIGAEKSDVPDLPIGAFDAALQSLAQRKGGTYVQIAGAGHYVMADHPQEVVAAMLGWLSKLP